VLDVALAGAVRDPAHVHARGHPQPDPVEYTAPLAKCSRILD
jgi:hypothetical protein